MTKRILLDCDEVLLEWDAGFNDYMKKLGYEKRHTVVDHYSLAERFGIKDIEAQMWVKNFNLSPKFGRLLPKPGAQDFIDSLTSDGYEVHVISSCGDDPLTVEHRCTNLEMVFGAHSFSSVKLLPLRQSKAYIFPEFEGCYFLDDYIGNALAAERDGNVIPVLITNGTTPTQPYDGIQLNTLMEFYHEYIAEPSARYA